LTAVLEASDFIVESVALAQLIRSKTANITIMSNRPINLSELGADVRDVEMPSCEVQSIQQLDGRYFDRDILYILLGFSSHTGFSSVQMSNEPFSC